MTKCRQYAVKAIHKQIFIFATNIKSMMFHCHSLINIVKCFFFTEVEKDKTCCCFLLFNSYQMEICWFESNTLNPPHKCRLLEFIYLPLY